MKPIKATFAVFLPLLLLGLYSATSANLAVAEQAPSTQLAVKDSRFTLNGKPVFLLGISYYGALGAPKEAIKRDLDDMQKHGFNWIRIWANWAAFGNDVAVVDPQGLPRPEQMKKLQWLVAECDRRGMIVDVSLSRGNGITGPPRLQTLQAHRRAVEEICTALKDYRNWYFDLSNERSIKDKRFISFDDLKTLQQTARKICPQLLITASHGSDISKNDLKEYLRTVGVDFICPHRPRNAKSPHQTEEKTRTYLQWMKELGKVVPVHYQEPFRRGYGAFQPSANDFLTDLRGALRGGAAGWCLHNGDQRKAKDGQPRRSFDMRAKRLFEQLDDEEWRVVREAAQQTK